MIKFKAQLRFLFKITNLYIDIAKEYMEKHIVRMLTI